MNPPAGQPPGPRAIDTRRVLVAIAILVVLASAVHRLARAGQTFFIDEIWVVDLVREGVYAPGAVPQPPLFFFAAVAASRLCGLGEVCLRMPSLLASILLALVPLASLRWTRGVLDERGALAWTVLLAFSSPIAFYAARVKQYPTEALGAAVILAACLAVVAMPESRRRWRAYFVLCAVLVPLLHSAGLVVLGTGLALTWIAARTDRKAALRVLAGHAALGLLFVAAYLAYMRPGQVTTERFGDLYDYFRAQREPAFFDGSLRFLVERSAHWLGQLLNVTRGMLLAAAAAIVWWGGSRLRQRDWSLLAVALACVVPPAAVLTASAFELYPYGEVRLMIFAAPAFFLLIALAIQHATAAGRRIGLTVSVVAASFVLLFIVRELQVRPYDASYMNVADFSATYSYVRAHHPPGVPILARKTHAVPLAYYLRGIAAPDVIFIEDHGAAPAVPDGEFWTLLDRDDRLALPRGEVLFEERGMLVRRHRK